VTDEYEKEIVEKALENYRSDLGINQITKKSTIDDILEKIENLKFEETE